MHFAGDVLGPVPYDRAHVTLPLSCDEGSGFDIAGGKLSMNTHLFKQTAQDAADHWRGQMISGRYAQPDDTRHPAVRLAHEGGGPHRGRVFGAIGPR